MESGRLERLRHLPNFLKVLIIILLAIVLLLPLSWTYVLWSIFQNVYYVKASLNWFATVFYNGYTFVAAALISLLLINPRTGHSDIWNLAIGIIETYGPRRIRPQPVNGIVGVPMQTGRSRWILWQFIKWTAGFVYFISNMGILPTGNLMNPLMMTVLGMGSWSQIPRLFLLPIMPATGSELISLMPTMEIQYKLLYIVGLTFIAVFAARMLLRTIKHLIQTYASRERYSPQAIENFNSSLHHLLLFAAAVIFSVIMRAPFWLMDVRTPFVYGIVWILLGLVIVGLLRLRTGASLTPRMLVSRRDTRRAAILLSIVLVTQLGVVALYQFNMNNNYLNYLYYPQISKEITVTRWAAGLDSIQTASIFNLPTSNTSTILSLVRQWDQQAASVTMTKDIGAYNWMTLSSTEIVFPEETEYWVAPTSPSFTSRDWISQHLIYTHASRVLVINTHTGVEVTPQQAFKIGNEPALYYGQTPQNVTGGFYGDVYVHIPGYNEIGNETYNGKPDYTLDGWQKNLWFTFAEGQLGFAFTNYPVEMLWNRDIFNRVQSILIPGLTVDPASYLASDGTNLYYVVQVYINYPLQSGFADSPYLRFFGVVLVNVYDGMMKGYTVSNLIGATPADFLSTFYNNYYSAWSNAPSWLASQIRYPEQLLGNPSVQGQLDHDFNYHVDDPFVWRSGSEFYERPTGNTVQYVPWAIGNRTYFVGMQLIHYVNATSQNLAGVYIAYGGDRLGQIYLYQNPTLNTTFIGPNAAENALQTNQQVRTQLTLLPNYRIGSYLLYSVDRRLDYFVAVYTNPGTQGVVTQLPFMTAIDPTTGDVGVGSTASAAYFTLPGTAPPPPTTNATQQLLIDVSSLIASKNYTLVNATTISANAFIKTQIISLNNLGLDQTIGQISNFITTYGPESAGNAMYESFDASGNLNIGVFKIRGTTIVEFYYIEITL